MSYNQNKFKQYLKEIHVSPSYKTQDILINLGVAQKKRGKLSLKNAGVLFFAKEPCKFFKSAYVDAVVFKGTERVRVISRKLLKGGLLENLDRARQFLEEHLDLRYEYKNDWKRENVYEIPIDALREAVVNALMHRDYFIFGANVSLSVFDDRVEIGSPGGLPKPLTKRDLGKISKRRNETVADLFARLDYVEKLATGIGKMRQWAKEAGLPAPKIDANGFFTITFIRKMSVKNVGKMSVKNVDKNKRMDLIIKKITVGEPITFSALARQFGVNEKTVERDMGELKRTGRIRFVGGKRNGHYECNEE